MTNHVYNTWNHLLEHEVELEDRREYEVDQLADMYEMSTEEAVQLQALIQGLFRPGVTPLDEIDQEVYKEYIQDSVHNSWEGFSKAEVVALTVMLFDLQLYFRDSVKPTVQ